MNRATVISVNPGAASVGCSNHLKINGVGILRSNIRIPARRPAANAFVDFLFPTRAAGIRMSALTLALRMLLGVMLICEGAGFGFLPQGFSLLPVLTIAAGVALVLGLLTRPVAFALFLMFIVPQFAAGTVQPVLLFMSLFSFICCAAGPGRASLDQLIRAGINSSVRRRAARRRLSYAAFSSF